MKISLEEKRKSNLKMEMRKILQNLLDSKGMNVAQLARITKIPKQTLHNWISGSKPRDLEQVQRVAIYFGVSLDFLLFGTETKISDPIIDFQNEINAGVFEVILRRAKSPTVEKKEKNHS